MNEDGMALKPSRLGDFWAWLVCPVIFLFSYVPKLNIVSRGVLVAFVIWFFGMLLFKRRSLLLARLPVVYIAWSFIALAASMFAVDLELVLRKWVSVVLMGLVSVAVANAINWRGSAQHWMAAFLMSAVLSYLSVYLPVQGYIMPDYDAEIGGRVLGTLGNANTYGRAMVHAFLIGVLWLILNRRSKQSLLVLLAMGVFGLSAIESSSRTAILGLLISLGAFVHCLKIRELLQPRNVLGLVGVAVGFSAVSVYWPERFITAIGRIANFLGFVGLMPQVSTSEQSMSNRLELAEAAFRTWVENPFGVGLDNFRLYVGTYAHSNYLELLVCTGLVGLFVYYSGFVAEIANQLARRNFNQESRTVVRLLSWTILVSCIMDVFNVSYYAKVVWLFFGVFSGVLATLGTSPAPDSNALPQAGISRKQFSSRFSNVLP